jgi:hypothetical protein
VSVFPGRGHGFARQNKSPSPRWPRISAKCLGGQTEPIGASLKASTVQVRYGAEFARGLVEASR